MILSCRNSGAPTNDRNVETVILDVFLSSVLFPFVSEFDEDCIRFDCSCSLRGSGREVRHGIWNG